MNPRPAIYIGFDPREAAAFAVARNSIRSTSTIPYPIHGLDLESLRHRGLYTRPTARRGGQLIDAISDAPMATEFALSRFLVPYLNGYQGAAMFMDCDMLVRRSVSPILEARMDKAVYVVKHDHRPVETLKMDAQAQTSYPRKNWSSVMVFNCGHPANRALTPDFVNSRRGLELHGFCWLKDDEIGELDPEWNWLAGHSDPAIDPAIVHFTDGMPFMAGYEDAPYAGEWWAALRRWAR